MGIGCIVPLFVKCQLIELHGSVDTEKMHVDQMPGEQKPQIQDILLAKIVSVASNRGNCKQGQEDCINASIVKQQAHGPMPRTWETSLDTNSLRLKWRAKHRHLRSDAPS
eukprot:scaffold484820_cov21-Prasinocladus_malaysianus.AAC.1